MLTDVMRIIHTHTHRLLEIITKDRYLCQSDCRSFESVVYMNSDVFCAVTHCVQGCLTCCDVCHKVQLLMTSDLSVFAEIVLYDSDIAVVINYQQFCV